MEKEIKRINELLEKKSKINQTDSLEATQLIYEVYCVNKDFDMLVNYLHDFYHKISGIFIKKYYFKLDKEEKNHIINSFLNHKRFYDNQAGTSLYKGFNILNEIILKDITDNNILMIINKITIIAEKNNKINPTACKIFLDFLNITNGEFFNLDLSALSKDELRRVFRYISETISDISTIAYGDKIQAWAEKYSFSVPKKPVVDNVETTQIIVPTTNLAKSVEIDSTKELIKTLQLANQEAQKLFDNIFSKNNTIQILQGKSNIKEKEINLLKEQIENKNTKLTSLNDHISKIEAELASKKIKINDLTERLKTSFNADDISKKQELITLKNDIATAVKLQYEDFNEFENESYNEDNYEALKVTLNQVFRTLKRYGIEL